MSPLPTDAPDDSATLAAIRRSVQVLDTDPGARTTPSFRSRGRLALFQSAPAAGGSSTIVRRLAIAGVTILLFGLIAMPALAGPGAIAHRVTGAAGAVGKVLGSGRGNQDSQDPGAANSPTEHPENHGADVSAVAKSTPTDDETHGEQVRTVARDNHGHQGNAGSDSDNGQDSAANGASGDDATTGSDQTHGAAVSTVARDNHGAEVSAAAQSAQGGQSASGEPVSAVAQDNHGAAVSAAAHAKSAAGENNGEQTTNDAN